MAHINKDEILKDVRKIINESIQEKPSMYDVTKKFNIHRYITGLIEEGHKNPELMNMLVRYDNMLNNGAKDFMIFEQFGNELSRYTSGNKNIKNIIKEMNESISENGMELMGYQLIENITDPYIKNTVSEAFTEYVSDKCADTLNNFHDALELVYQVNEQLAMQLNLVTTQDVKMSNRFIQSDYVTDNQYEILQKQLQEAREKRQAEEIYEKVEKYLQNKFEAQEQSLNEEQSRLCLDYIANNNGLNLGVHLANIANSDAKTNPRLMQVVEAYSNAINQGAYEERLYETLLQNISKFNYLVPVEKEIKAINEKVKEKKEQITLTQLLEEMKDNQYSFIYVDLIQEDVARYVQDPTPNNRVQLRNALAPYASDPYINEMFNVIYADNLKRDKELSEKALNIKDQINIIRENASVSSIYTPVQYIKENECIFNVNGQYYVKKGNSIAILEDKYVDQLDESFVELCHLVNDPHVEIHENYIEVFGNNNLYAKVFEGYVDILGTRESRESLRDLRTMCMKHDNYDTNFYIMCSCLHENFNNIAKIDWAKHVTLNENHNISADLFKLDEHIFIATHNDTLSQHVFYRNVNPIFCKNKLNEHMGINVSALFTDLLPSQDKIILKLNETKSSYEESIEKYEDMIEQLKEMEKTVSDDNKEEIHKAIEDAESKLDDVKKEYKEWQEKANDATGESDDSEEVTDDTESEEDDENVIKEPANEPVSDEEVEDSMDELTQPIDADDDSIEAAADGEEVDSISDDEFDSFLSDDDSNDNEEVTDDTGSEEDIFEPDTEEDNTEIVVDGEDSYDDDAIDFAEFDEDDTDDDIEDQEEFAEIKLDDDTDDSEEVVDDVVSDDSLSDEDVFGSDDESEESFEAEVDNVLGDTDDNVEDITVEDDTEDYDGHEATDIFGGDTEDPTETKYDAEPLPANIPTTSDDVTSTESDFAYKIANVMFDENVKTGVSMKSGSVIAIIPMVNGEGEKYIENKTITFYIDDNSNVILNNEEMSSDLYNAVINSIKSHPAFQAVCQNGEASEIPIIKSETVSTNTEDDSDLTWEEEYLRDGNNEDRKDYMNDDDDDEWSYLDTVLGKYDETPETVEIDTVGIGEEVPEETFSMDDTDDETEDIVIPMYKEGDTEIELPAATTDGTIIPESVKTPKKKSLKESIKISAVYKHKGQEKRFFVNEATVNASKNKNEQSNIKPSGFNGNIINESIREDYGDMENNRPLENFDESEDIQVIGQLHSFAKRFFKIAQDNGYVTGNISDLSTYGDPAYISEHITYFDVESDLSTVELGNYKQYRIYQYDHNIYYIDINDVAEIMENNKYEGFESIINNMIELSEMSVNIEHPDDCMFMMESILKSMYNFSTVNENAKIRRKTKIQTDNDIDLSKTVHDAKYGTKEENDFKQELEDKQKKDGTIGALDPAQEESVKPMLPNVNLITEKKFEIIWEVNDPVIYKDEIWHIYAIDEFDTDKQRLHITKNGHTETVLGTDVKPDPETLKSLEDSEYNYDTDNLQGMMTKQDLKDLNKRAIECNIVVDGYKISSVPVKASLTDIMESKEYLDIESVDGSVDKMHINNIQFDYENWPYAVIANEDDEPIRKIKVNPVSYINADDDDMVEVTVADKLTTLPKHSIRILS